VIVRIPVKVSNIQEPNKKTENIEVIVDIGSTYCWIPKDELKKIGILEHGKRSFKTISGERVERPFGYAWFSYDGASGGSEVVFAEPSDGIVLGELAMGGMGLTVDPRNGKITKEDVFLAL
jgi:predicted aspartyl protease